MKKNIDELVSSFFSSPAFNEYTNKHPISAKEIVLFIKKFTKKYSKIVSARELIKTLENSTHGDSPPLKWFNIFSQLRCAYFLNDNYCRIVGFEQTKPKGNKRLDIKFSNCKYCDVKLFSTQTKGDKEPWNFDEAIIKEFVEKKLKPAFNEQRADLIVIDDIFSVYSKKYGLLNYILSFLEFPNTQRYEILKQYLSPYQDKIMILSFTKSVTIDPLIRYRGTHF
jgi:hypothetical protein